MEGQDETAPRGMGEEETVNSRSTPRCLGAREMAADRRALREGRKPTDRLVATPTDASGSKLSNASYGSQSTAPLYPSPAPRNSGGERNRSRGSGRGGTPHALLWGGPPHSYVVWLPPLHPSPYVAMCAGFGYEGWEVDRYARRPD
jgi:hypothetical protein